MAFLERLQNLFTPARSETPQAMDRYTRTPIYFTDDTIKLFGGDAHGLYDPRRKDITVSRKGPKNTLQHEIIHSIFDQTSPQRSLFNWNPRGSMLEKAKKGSSYKDLDDDEFEHLMIQLLQGENTQKGALDSLLKNLSTPEEKKAGENLKKMFKVK